MASNYDPARQAQMAYCHEQNALRIRLMERMVNTDPPPADMPEAYDGWVSDARLTYFGVWAVVTYELKRYWQLEKGKGPFYCQRCEEPQDGWEKMLCWECAWTGKIRPYAIDMATTWWSTRAVPA